MWKTLNTSKIFDHPRITLLEDEVELPDGSQTKYLKFLNKGNGADIIAINENGEILLQKEYNHPVQKELWQFPGGFIDKDENNEDAARRELLEETGYTAETFTPIGFHYIYRRRISEQSFVFVAKGLKHVGEQRESSEVGMIQEWFTKNQIDQMIREGEITAGDTLAIWMLYKTNYQTG